MLKRLPSRDILVNLAYEWEPFARQAWLDAINSITSAIVLKNLVAEIERGNVSGAIGLLGLERDTLARFEAVLLQAYNAGGFATVDAMPRLRDPNGNRILFSWGVRNLAGEAELRAHAAGAVTGILDDTRDGLREVLTDALSRGRNPRKTSLQIVGRINRLTGRREGGLIGLSRPQMQTVAVLREALATGDVAKLREIIGMRADGTLDPRKGWKLRDRRFDRSIAKAIREGTAITSESIEKIARQYSNRALAYRGTAIARHETLGALAKSGNDAFRQQVDAGKLDAQDLTKTWHHTAQENPRLQHVAMAGQIVAFDQPFVAPDGTELMYPLDPSAPIAHTAGCKCRADMTIDFTAQALRRYQERIGG